MEIRITSAQRAPVSVCNFLFFSPDGGRDVSCHFTRLYLFVFYYKTLLFDFQPGAAKPHKDACDYHFQSNFSSAHMKLGFRFLKSFLSWTSVKYSVY